jgi:thiamine biosynthesis lipoprotein
MVRKIEKLGQTLFFQQFLFKKKWGLSLIFLLFISCAKPMHKKVFVISGTYLEVTSSQKDAGKIVYNEFKRLDKIFNLYDENSELSRLNKTFNQPFKASAELIEALNLAKQAYDLSQGAFDISQGRLYQFWKGFMESEPIEHFPSPEEIDEIKKLGGMDKIVINSKENTVTLNGEGLVIDLGGIAKGYMVDKAVLKLKENGINSALVNAGGDMYCLGINKDRPWKVGIKDPLLEGVLETQQLIDEAIATSGNYEQFFEYRGKRYSHLVDPRSGFPVDSKVLSVSIITKNCTSADSLATAFFVSGLEGVKKFLAQNPSTMRIFVVSQDEKGKNIHMFQ